MGVKKREKIRNINSLRELSHYLECDEKTRSEIEKVALRYPFAVSSYVASLMDPYDLNCPLRRQFLPDIRELTDNIGNPDPLLEETHLVAKRVIKVYPDRVAVIVSGSCASLCRFCFRKNRLLKNPLVKEAEREEALEYIARDKEIRDVLVTGGEPLLLSEKILDNFLKRLRAIKQVEIIRLGTRLLSTFPQRITSRLASILAKYHPLWINLHFNHPKELTEEAEIAANNLLSRGIPLGNQAVLLKGVNDNLETMKTLHRGLLKMRIRPYCLYQCHLVEGTAHFRTPIETGQAILAGLRGHISGLAIPSYILDTPYGKVPLNPNYLMGREGMVIRVKTYDGRVWEEFNPQE